jgi:hypothetical protein
VAAVEALPERRGVVVDEDVLDVEAWELDDVEESARRLPRINRYMGDLYSRP